MGLQLSKCSDQFGGFLWGINLRCKKLVRLNAEVFANKEELTLPDETQEWKFILAQKKTCYNGIYPFKIFPQKELRRVEFEPLTVFYGGNGSGKTTLLNIIAQLAEISRCSVFSGGAFFEDYLDRCELDARKIPKKSRILTSDDVFDYLLNVRNLNNGIDVKREMIFEDLYARREAAMLDPANIRLPSLSDDEESKWETVGMRGNRRVYLRQCQYKAGIQHEGTSVILQQDLHVYGISHPQAKGGYSPEMYANALKSQL